MPSGMVCPIIDIYSRPLFNSSSSPGTCCDRYSFRVAPWLSEALPVPRFPWYYRLLPGTIARYYSGRPRIVLFLSRSTGHPAESGSRDAHDIRQSPCPSRPVLGAFPFSQLLRRQRRAWRWPFLRRVRFVDRGLLRVDRHFWIDNGRGHH